MKNLFTLFLFTILSNYALVAQQFLDKTLVYDGNTREYTIYLPDNHQSTTALPLMFNFHGGGGDIASQIAIADMSAIADTAGFIVVYPQALPDPNDGGSTNWIHKDPTMVDDVFFIDALIAEINTEYAIDANRIYACGYSLGGEFTYELACRLNEQIAAIGVVARTMGTAAHDNCMPSHPTGILTILGTDDFISPYGGLTFNGIQYYLSADDMHEYWSTYNNASSTPTITPLPNSNSSDGSTVERHSWTDGDGCVTVEHLKVIGGGHDWPGSFGNMDIDASLEIWNYVSQYSLEGLIGCGTTSVFGESDKGTEISISPNPVGDFVYVDLGGADYRFYQVYTVMGQLILSGRFGGDGTRIDVSALDANVYFLRVGNSVVKIIKK